MLKPGFYLFLFFFHAQIVHSQSEGSFRWVLPLESGPAPIGEPSPDFFAVAEKGKVYLTSLSGEKKQLPYDSASHEYGKFWRVWQNNLQGIFHIEKGEQVPPVFENVRMVSKEEKNWAYQVNKYGMYAIVNSRNRLLLPYQKNDYARLSLVGDTLLAYLKHDVYNFVNADLLYISPNGYAPPHGTVKPPAPNEFQRISSNQYVFTYTQNNKIRRDTFVAAEKFVGDVAVVKRDTQWGYWRNNGTWLVPPRFQAAQPFDSLGQAVVKSRGKYGVILQNGNFLIEPRFTFLKPFVPGFFEFKENGKIGLVNAAGKVVIPAGAFSDFLEAGTECFVAKSKDSILIFNRSGAVLPIGKVVAYSRKKVDAQFWVRIQLKSPDEALLWGVLAPDGKWRIPPVIGGQGQPAEFRHFFVAPTSLFPCCTINGFNAETNRPGKFIVFDRNGTPVLNVVVDEVLPARDEKTPFVVYRQDQKFGLLGPGNAHLKAEFDEVKTSGEWAFVRKNQQWGALKWSK